MGAMYRIIRRLGVVHKWRHVNFDIFESPFLTFCLVIIIEVSLYFRHIIIDPSVMSFVNDPLVNLQLRFLKRLCVMNLNENYDSRRVIIELLFQFLVGYTRRSKYFIHKNCVNCTFRKIRYAKTTHTLYLWWQRLFLNYMYQSSFCIHENALKLFLFLRVHLSTKENVSQSYFLVVKWNGLKNNKNCNI